MSTGTKFSKKQSAYWDSYTRGIDTLDLIKIPKAEKLELTFLIDVLGDLKNKSVLDLGCGTGKFGLKLAKYAKNVVGIDISKVSIDIANKTAKKYHIKNFSGLIGDFKDQGYNKSFDVIIAINLFHHADDLELILKHVSLALKNDGKLIVFEMNPLNLLFIPFLTIQGQIMSHLTWQYLRSNIFSLRTVLNKNNFFIVDERRWGWLPTSLYNKSLVFMQLNQVLNKIPIVNTFTAFNILICRKYSIKKNA